MPEAVFSIKTIQCFHKFITFVNNKYVETKLISHFYEETLIDT